MENCKIELPSMHGTTLLTGIISLFLGIHFQIKILEIIGLCIIGYCALLIIVLMILFAFALLFSLIVIISEILKGN